jgi:glucan 1,3-beta-glucosidase
MPEGGSGTMMGDLTFNGGMELVLKLIYRTYVSMLIMHIYVGVIGLDMNNQQYEGKSLTFNGCTTGIKVDHCFDCVFINCNFMNAAAGIDMTGGSVGSVVLLDSTASNLGTVLVTTAESTGDHTLVIENFVKGVFKILSNMMSLIRRLGPTILVTVLINIQALAYLALCPRVAPAFSTVM